MNEESDWSRLIKEFEIYPRAKIKVTIIKTLEEKCGPLVGSPSDSAVWNLYIELADSIQDAIKCLSGAWYEIAVDALVISDGVVIVPNGGPGPLIRFKESFLSTEEILEVAEDSCQVLDAERTYLSSLIKTLNEVNLTNNESLHLTLVCLLKKINAAYDDEFWYKPYISVLNWLIDAKFATVPVGANREVSGWMERNLEYFEFDFPHKYEKAAADFSLIIRKLEQMRNG